jgi:hypothetical protein
MFSYLLILSAYSSIASTSNVYTIDDLKVLAEGNSYREFLAHAKDIAPTKRDKQWRRLVVSQAIGLVDELRSEKNFKKKSFKLAESIASWTILKRDEFYQIKRDAYALSYFNHCFTHASQIKLCRRELLAFWQRSLKKPDTGFKLATLLQGFLPTSEKWSLIKEVMTQADSHFYCQKPLILNTFITHLTSLELEITNNIARKFKLQAMADIKCWNALLPQIKQELWTLPPTEGRNLYHTLISFNQLNQTDQDLWLTLYLLDNPVVGDLFNIAWNRLKELGSQFKRRHAVHQRLRTNEPLPGNSFNHKSLSITRHFNRYFPEYIATYAKTCVDYLEGNKHFNYGNPTIYCDQLFTRDKKGNNKVIIQTLHSRYSAIKK